MSFANALTEAMEQKGMDIDTLAKKVDSSYEYIRQLGKGNAFPGRQMLKAITTALHVDYGSMWNLVVSDKLAKKYGPGAYDAIGKNPRFLEIERLLPQLTEEQFQTVLGMIEGIARRNRVQHIEASRIKAQPRHAAKDKYLALAKPKSKAVHPAVLKAEAATEVKR